MTEVWTGHRYAPRDSQDSNQLYPSNQLALPHYSHGDGINYLNGSGGHHFPTMAPSYTTYSTPYVPSHSAPGPLMYMHPPSLGPMSCHLQSSSNASLGLHSRSASHTTYYPAPMQTHRTSHPHARLPLLPQVCLADTEDQESPNHDSMRSEPVSPPLEGYPDVHEFDELMKSYVDHLSPKKQDKALIHAKRAANIKAVLVDKKTTSVESAQFRFWVKKMFTLEPKDSSVPSRKKKICHEGKPVAIREKLFKILIKAHKTCQHGGRDKTSAQVRRVYSWVPKELISRFVKLCPTCQVRRGTSRTSPHSPDHSMSTYFGAQSPENKLPSHPGRYSHTTNAFPDVHSPPQLSGCSQAFQKQNRWMTPVHTTDKTTDHIATLEAAASAMADVEMNMDNPGTSNVMPPAPSKFAQDPGTPYMSTPGMHCGTNSAYYQNYYNRTNPANGGRHADYLHRAPRTSTFKVEHRY